MNSITVDNVTIFPGIPLPNGGAPCPKIHADGLALQLSYFSDDFSFIRQFSVPNVARAGDGFVVDILFDLPLWHSFGYPNDEALGGHPLYQRGLRFYQPHLIGNSSTIERFHRQNLVSFPDTGNLWSDCRHLIFTFKDETFECVFNGPLTIKISGADSWTSNV
jgi:hypothetical protein